ncbi:hypothetical protein EUX98_g5254 [Antrodiella citrinella]|uniref:F-box domain-containing protein n=1 Tax=Antrodiella citrinella TaxID=2447956 RepID=A0A4S4MZS8_9APHY|nr:hypothetical protein EUX98_g5254 [Antrodiella citrinella]
MSVPLGLPSLPTEIWERIIDHIAHDWRTLGSLSARRTLVPCTLVSRAWLPRARFHLCNTVTLSSHRQIASFNTLLTNNPSLAADVTLLVVGLFKSERGDHTWVYSVPSLLPPLSNLRAITYVDIDFSRQPVEFYKVLARFRSTSRVESLQFRAYDPVSGRSFYHFFRLAHVLRVQHVEIEDLAQKPVYQCIVVDGAGLRLCLHISNLEDLLAVEHDPVWARICQDFRRQIAAMRTEGGESPFRMTLTWPGFAFYMGFMGSEPGLFMAYSLGETSTRGMQDVISAWSAVLRRVKTCPFTFVVVDLKISDTAWRWEDYMPETWRAVDDALESSRDFASLRRVLVMLPDVLPPHAAATMRYACVDEFIQQGDDALGTYAQVDAPPV